MPILIVDTVRSLLERLFISKVHDTSTMILAKNEFVISERNITTWFMLSAYDKNIDTLIKSIEKARAH